MEHGLNSSRFDLATGTPAASERQIQKSMYILHYSPHMLFSDPMTSAHTPSHPLLSV
jgi:hypothetical protein